jgi:RNA polymerase sigma factor (sigma-70 family)
MTELSQNNFNNEDLVESIRRRDNGAFEYLRLQCYDVVSMLVTSNSGSEADAEDVYHEGIFGLIKVVDNPQLVLTCKLTTLFISICKRQWLVVLQKRKADRTYQSDLHETSYDEEIERKMDKEIFNSILWTSFERLKQDCKIILRGYMQGMSVKEIAGLMGLSTSHVKKKKHYCHKYLIQYISEHPDYKRIEVEDEIKIC